MEKHDNIHSLIQKYLLKDYYVFALIEFTKILL